MDSKYRSLPNDPESDIQQKVDDRGRAQAFFALGLGLGGLLGFIGGIILGVNYWAQRK